LRQSYIPLVRLSKPTQKSRKAKRTRRAKINPKIVAYFSHFKKAHPKHHDPPHKTPPSHHQITTPNSFLFPKPPQKIRQKNGKPPHGPYQDFFAKPHHPPAHPAVITADKDA
jgi:hypothetical protein